MTEQQFYAWLKAYVAVPDQFLYPHLTKNPQGMVTRKDFTDMGLNTSTPGKVIASINYHPTDASQHQYIVY